MFLKRLMFVFISLLLLPLAPTRVESGPMLFGSNHYQFIEVSDPFPDNTWWSARDAAAASIYQGVSGHLATITSQAENDFLFGLVPGSVTGFKGAWIGGGYSSGSHKWLVGPEINQLINYPNAWNWGGIEPNNNGYMYMLIGSTYAGVSPGEWMDDSTEGGAGQGIPSSTADPVIGYFVEYEGTGLIPAPSPLLLLLGGTWGLLRIGRYRSR